MLNTLGGLQFRAGDPAGARRSLDEGLGLVNGKGVAQDWIFLAMAAQALGDAASAGSYLRRLDSADPPDEFWEAAEVSVLRREAQRLLEVRSPEP